MGTKRAARPGEGRPSKYDPLYCRTVVEHLTDGSSLTSFAASIDVARSTINEWMAAYPEFSEACARAKAKASAWWERQGRLIAANGGSSAQGSMAQFGMKNMGADDWKESSQIDHRSGDGSMSPPTLAEFYGRPKSANGGDNG